MNRTLISYARTFVLLAFVPLGALAMEVGQVVFSSGDTQIVGAGSSRAAKVGEVVRQGDELVTKEGAHVYVKTRDNGFVSLRPNSAVHFDVFEYVAEKPQESRFKTTLKYGVMRSVSGVGAQSARDKYRLNTPVAAIGIRGTDFTVYANAEVTRATVTSGGIVMSGFNENCTPSGIGPCSGAQVAELFAKQTGMILQIKQGDARPALLDKDAAGARPDAVSPPLPGEKIEKGAASGNTADTAGQQALIVKQGSALQEKLEQEVGKVAPPPPPPQQVHWGRWLPLAGQAGPSAFEALLASGKQLVGFNSILGMAKDPQSNFVLPSAGVYSFALQSHESYILDESSRLMSSAKIENPNLSIDFNQQIFSTSFQLTSDTRQFSISGKGSVARDGTMVSEQIGSPATIRGAVANDGQQAGFLFEQRLNQRELATGATFWSR